MAKPHHEYIKAKRAFLAGKMCAKCGCGRPLDPHHWSGTAGPLKTDFRMILPMCRKCHDEIHRHMDQARSDGWLCPVGCWNDPKRALVAWEKRRKNLLRPDARNEKVDLSC